MRCFHVESDCPPIENAQTLFDILKSFRKLGTCGDVYLRGHADAQWPIVPTIGRRNSYCYGSEALEEFSPTQESDLLDRFRRYAYSIVGRELTLWEGLFLARHHGLPVRLLDWTSNPLVALFNAVKSHEEAGRDGAIWLLRRKGDRKNDIRVLEEEVNPFNIKGVRMIYPVYVTPRLVVQSGCFTIHDYPWKDLRQQNPHEFQEGDFDLECLKMLRVPSDKKLELLRYLMRAGINSRTLYPDLDGLARGLWELEVVRD